jgi:hypothetical protein
MPSLALSVAATSIVVSTPKPSTLRASVTCATVVSKSPFAGTLKTN